MKFIHLSDLHIGKRLNEFSLIDDQKYILNEILTIVHKESPDAVFIAGDIYDKSVPPSEAITLFDNFVSILMMHKLKLFVISGNHDSPERISFGANIMRKGNVFISPVYNGQVTSETISDEHGNVNIFMLPFVKAVNIKRFFPESEIESITDGVREAIKEMHVDESERNILITHLFVAGSSLCESEEISIGGVESVDTEVFSPFDFVALGHLHRPQRVTRDTIRYCGTPLKYSFSETNDVKSLTVVTMHEKGNVEIRTIPLDSKKDMIELQGTYMELTARKFYESIDTNSYIHITLTDENDIPDALSKLRSIYPNIMKLDYNNTRTRSDNTIVGASEIESKTPLELFKSFYKEQNNGEMTAEQEQYVSKILEILQQK